MKSDRKRYGIPNALFTLSEQAKGYPALTYLALLMLGGISGYLIIVTTNFLSEAQLSQITNTYMGTRLRHLQRAIQAINGQEFTPISTHQPAYYYYLALLNKVLHKAEPWQLLLWMQMAASWIVLTAYPAILYRLTKSLFVAVLTPVFIYVFLGRYLFLVKTDLYWGYAWAVSLGVPLLAILASERWSKNSWYFYTALCCIISASNVLRTQVALPITILLLGIVTFKLFVKWERDCKKITCASQIAIFLKRNIPLLIALIILFTSQGFLARTVPSIILPSFIGKGDRGITQGPWHSAYIGLGWKENKYGITYKDECAIAKALELKPGVKYLSEEYMAILKAEYFTILTEDPAFVAKLYWQKFAKNMSLCFKYFKRVSKRGATFVGIMLFLIIVERRLRPKTTRYSLSNGIHKVLTSPPVLMFPFALFCVFANMTTAMIAVPRNNYLIGSYTACGMLVFTIVVLLTLYTTNIFGQRIKACQGSNN